MRKILLTLVLAVLFFGATHPAYAQDDALTLRITRDFGYGGVNNEIEGLFSLRAAGAEDLVRVDFYMDGDLMASVDTEPFNFQFTTKDYAPGGHTFYAVGTRSDGSEVRSNEIYRVFLSSEEAGAKVREIIVPLITIIAAVTVLGIAIPAFFSRNKAEIGKYGILGGAVCPKCALPMPFYIWAPNMVVGKLQRCPHCGKWSVMRRAGAAELAAAEERWREARNEGAPGMDATEERRKKQIDNSRYDN
jgi:Zn ribbon nucleic-acid-binding protein